MNNGLTTRGLPIVPITDSESTDKKISFSIEPNRSTNADLKPSIFDLPKEALEKLEKRYDNNGDQPFPFNKTDHRTG